MTTRRLVASWAGLALSLAAVLSSATARALTSNTCSFTAADTAFTYNQSAFEAQNSEIRLTDAVSNEAASAWYSTPIPLAATTAVHAHFIFQMGPSAAGGDGIAFVMQNSMAGLSALGGPAGSMGYGGATFITPSAIIEFDTFRNGGGDPNANHVGLMLTGSATNHAVTASPAFTMAGGGQLNAWVDYDPTAHTISVYLSQTSLKPGAALFSHALNLFSMLGSQMFVGFTSATGPNAEINEHDVFELEVSTAGIPCSCEGDSACSGVTPACAVSGICATCSATNTSACTGATPVCQVATNTCVGCLGNADCSGSTPICDGSSLTCRACAGPADCSGATPQCATMGANTGTCVVCVVDPNCPPTAPRCTSSNTCVQCVSAADCGGDSPVCTAGTCRACATDADCGGATPACEVWGACGQCSSTNGAACAGGTSICDFPSGTCVGCEFNSDCGGSSPTCNVATHTCHPCQSNADCTGNPGGAACVTAGMKVGSCVVCQLDSDCLSPAAPKCDVTADECVGCLSNIDCAAPTPVCGPSNLCVGCLTSSDCTSATPVCDATSSSCKACANDYAAINPGPVPCPTAALPACQPAGTPLAGQCALCSAGNDGACATQASTPVCVVATATCGCMKDTDCNPDSYCDTSTTTSGTCSTGCREAGGVDNCATGKYCSTTDGSVGACTSQVCNSNADCMSPDPVCDTIAQPHVCVTCLNDPDCPGGQVCDEANHCVTCTATHTKNCSASGTGAACLASGLCGCAADSDCGTAASGRVCNASHACEDGCRATGGNGCPSPGVCSSTGSAIGRCQGGMAEAGPPAVDAGSDAGHVAADAAPVGHVVSESQGCGCRVVKAPDEQGGPALLAILAGVALVLRRRRSRPSPEAVLREDR